MTPQVTTSTRPKSLGITQLRQMELRKLLTQGAQSTLPTLKVNHPLWTHGLLARAHL